ncbi:MAG TPA: MgtC/SapB family protein [Sphingopyxis sp.]|uniref:MgtC/SapB family protein n=1 Tax=Sphingopyxis sp. TaxID=1908224 RepID=UPI002BD1E866|nr:MgtC/SapB family protein [Sphingopyxis sp.]HWW59419.1 MgtC/SapB family protein [Sphingopyxis sp.]
MQLLSPDLIWPIAGAIIAGAVIGAEREYRASPAGLRTHILVSLSCCLLMLSAAHQMAWLNDAPLEVVRIDPVRMAHGVLTGIGFLCGGVIFREGFNVRGLTTAASLWMTATLGMLFGIGFYELAIFGAVATVLVLAAVTITERRAPQRRVVHLKARYTRSAAIEPRAFNALLADHGLRSITTEQNLSDGIIEYGAIADGYDEERGERLVAALASDTNVQGFEIRPQQA